MKKILIIIFAFLLCPNISSAKTSTNNSAKMHQFCKLWIKKDNGQSLGQINLTKAIVCSWYFKGMFDSSVVVQVMNNIKSGKNASSLKQARLNGMCAPKNFSTGQWIRVFVKYLDDNPQYLNKSVSINSTAALGKYYRCKR